MINLGFFVMSHQKSRLYVINGCAIIMIFLDLSMHFRKNLIERDEILLYLMISPELTSRIYYAFLTRQQLLKSLQKHVETCLKYSYFVSVLKA
jgi:hypothetical protein